MLQNALAHQKDVQRYTQSSSLLSSVLRRHIKPGCDIAGAALVSPAPGYAEMQTPVSQVMAPAAPATPAESVGSVWAPDAVSVSKAPARKDWPSNGFGRVLEEPCTEQKACLAEDTPHSKQPGSGFGSLLEQPHTEPTAGLAEDTPCSKQPSNRVLEVSGTRGSPSACDAEDTPCSGLQCGASADDNAHDAAASPGGPADPDEYCDSLASKKAALEQDESVRLQQEGSSAREQYQNAKPASSQPRLPSDRGHLETLQSAGESPMQLPTERIDFGAASAAGGAWQEDSSAGFSPCSSQLAYANVASNAILPLADRLPKAGPSLRLEQLPFPALLPASCPATPAGQRWQPAPEEVTPTLFGRPASAGVQSAR